MTTQTLGLPTLAGTLWTNPSLSKNITLAVVGAVLLTVSAKLKIPFYPVPLTMQTFMVLGIGMVYGWKLGASTVLLYLLAGALGMPVFAGTPEKGLGLAYMMGPTGGYLLGFVMAALTTGYLAQRGWDRRMSTTFLAMLAGNMVIYIPGLIWLGAIVGWDKPVLEWGMFPFLWGDLAKIALAMVVLPGAWKLVSQRQSKTGKQNS